MTGPEAIRPVGRDLQDNELLAMACNGRDAEVARQAASDLLQRYHVLVFRWCRAQLGDPDLAADIAQEVLVKAYRNLGSFEGQARFSSWLFAIVRNRCLDELRRPRLLVAEDAQGIPVDDSATPSEAYEQASSEQELKDLLARHLAPDEQEVLILRYFECMPVAEITRTLGITARSGARGVLQKARRKLQAALRTKGDFDHE